MVFKHKIFDFDFRNNLVTAQAAVIDAFFQNNNIESWSISNNETILVTYSENDNTNPTRFAVVIFGFSPKNDLVGIDSDVTLLNITNNNHVIKTQFLDNRMVIVHYQEGEITLEKTLKNKRINATDLSAVTGSPAYAEISNESVGPEQTGIGTTAVKITQFDTIGLSKNMTISGPNNNITIDVTGLYSVEYYLSFSGSNSATFITAIYVNGVEITKSATVRKLTNSGDAGSVANRCILNLTAGDVVDLRARATNANNSLTLQVGNFIIQKVR